MRVWIVWKRNHTALKHMDEFEWQSLDQPRNTSFEIVFFKWMENHKQYLIESHCNGFDQFKNLENLAVEMRKWRIRTQKHAQIERIFSPAKCPFPKWKRQSLDSVIPSWFFVTQNHTAHQKVNMCHSKNSIYQMCVQNGERVQYKATHKTYVRCCCEWVFLCFLRREKKRNFSVALCQNTATERQQIIKLNRPKTKETRRKKELEMDVCVRMGKWP